MLRARRARLLAIAMPVMATLAPACTARELAPFGQLRLRIDTDAPVPGVVSRLRIDVFSDSAWIDSRDVSLRDRTALPASFTLLSSDVSRDTRVRVRLRAYSEGALRDYRGDRFVPPPPESAPNGALPVEPPATNDPRLVKAGNDVTPRDEPLPGLAIDRLIATTLHEGQVVDAFVMLRIDCAGTMADVSSERTCLTTRGVLVKTPDAANGSNVAEMPGDAAWRARLDADLRALPPKRDGEIVVPGGVLVLGSREDGVRFAQAGTSISAEPERVFVIPPMLVDKEEVTVARFREVLARGFVPPEVPLGNDEPGLAVEGAANGRACTFSTTPFTGKDAREDMPMTCTPWATARAFCKYLGADLPTEAAFEWLATSSGRPRKTAFPWGDAPPTCDGVVFGRMSIGGTPTPCGGAPRSLGPLAVTAGPMDVSPEGVHGLGGNVLEHVRDSYFGYEAACWARAPLYDPVCEGDGDADVVARGGGWATDVLSSSALRVPTPAGTLAYDVGFRCVRR